MRLLLPLMIAAAALAAAAAGQPAPDGVIVFERRSGAAAADLYAVRPDGTGLRRLTRTRNNVDPAVSPDGRSIAFASHRAHGPGATEIFVMRSNGTSVRRLTKNARSNRAYTIDADPTWSRDGRTIAFSRTFVRGGRSSTDLFSVPAAGGPVTRLTREAGKETAPAYSSPPELTYVRDGWVHSLLGTLRIRMFRGEDPEYSIRNHVALSRDGLIIRNEWQGERTVGTGTDPTWSPDGTRLAWVTNDGIAVEGKPITNPDAATRDLSPSWGAPAR